MGGNVIAINKLTGEETPAERVDLRKVGRQEFIKAATNLFKFINKDFKKKYKESLWQDESILLDGSVFNGSTSYIMNQELSDEEVVKYKPSAGDIDIMVPVGTKENLWHLLDSYEGKEIVSGVRYAGSNKPSVSSIGSQINCVFVVDFGDLQVPIQVDFEFVPFAGATPTEWARFSHSSSFADAKEGIKAVHHKFLIRALVGGASAREDIVIATPKSTAEDITLTKSKEHLLPRMLKFSVDRGIRVAYEPLRDAKGNIMVLDGKQVYKPIPTSNSNFETIVREIYKLAFQQVDGNESEVQKFNSFIGVVALMKKHFTPKQIKDTTDRYIELLWGSKGQRGQELERSDPEGDYQVKNSGYEYYIKALRVKDERPKYVNAYYKTYRVDENTDVVDPDFIWESVGQSRIKSLREYINL